MPTPISAKDKIQDDRAITSYNNLQEGENHAICSFLFDQIRKYLPKAEYKIWHAHPVWFLDGNPITGYSKLKSGIRLMFWSGADFDEDSLVPGTGKFKDASITYTAAEQISTKDLKRWLTKATKIQWDYKNVVKRKGVLKRLK